MKNTTINSMKKDSRLLVRLTFADGSQRGWGYDYPHYPTAEYLQINLEQDFAVIPSNTEIRLIYCTHEQVITPTTGDELAQQAIDWLQSTGDFI